VISSRHFGDN